MAAFSNVSIANLMIDILKLERDPQVDCFELAHGEV